jgi:hypothetical protein
MTKGAVDQLVSIVSSQPKQEKLLFYNDLYNIDDKSKDCAKSEATMTKGKDIYL